jgi:hypothetical protein
MFLFPLMITFLFPNPLMELSAYGIVSQESNYLYFLN